MAIHTNKELAQAVNAAIKESGYKKNWIADQLGIQKESFARTLNKKQFSLDDANKILELIGLETETKITKKVKKINEKC